MSSETETRCIVEVPFEVRFAIRVHTYEKRLKNETKHLQEPDQEWELQAQRVIQRWLDQEIVPKLQGELHAIAPFGNLDSHAAWVMGAGEWMGQSGYGRSHVTDITYVADEARLVDE